MERLRRRRAACSCWLFVVMGLNVAMAELPAREPAHGAQLLRRGAGAGAGPQQAGRAPLHPQARRHRPRRAVHRARAPPPAHVLLHPGERPGAGHRRAPPGARGRGAAAGAAHWSARAGRGLHRRARSRPRTRCASTRSTRRSSPWREGEGGYFSYLADTAARVEIVEGDARISLERELERGQAQGFDVLAVDVFSSDAIPVHLLTHEAVALYRQHLAPHGVLALHISNAHLDLVPVTRSSTRGPSACTPPWSSTSPRMMRRAACG